MKRSAYSLVAWGVALSLINFHIENFNSSILGYLLLMRGAYRLRQLGGANRYYGIAVAGSFLQTVLACAAMAGMRVNLSLFGNGEFTATKVMFISIAIAAGMVTMLGIITGIKADAESIGARSLAHSARLTWNALFAINGSGLFLLPFLLNVADFHAIWGSLIFGGAAFIVQVRIFFLVRQARRMLGGGSGTQGIVQDVDQPDLQPQQTGI